MLFFLDSFRIIGDSIGLPSLNRNSVSTERVDTPSACHPSRMPLSSTSSTHSGIAEKANSVAQCGMRDSLGRSPPL